MASDGKGTGGRPLGTAFAGTGLQGGMKRNSDTASGCSGTDPGKQEIEQLFGRRELRHDVGMSERPPIPSEERLPAWRRACLAYHEWLQAGANDHEAHEAAVAALQTVLPLPWQEASCPKVVRQDESNS